VNNLLKTALDAALRAGGAILEIYKRDFDVEFKADESPLTEADKAAHCIICDALEDTGLPILSEESKTVAYDVRKAWKKYWLVDPLDGTKEFIKKNGEFTVNIALIENGRPIMGVVYAPVLRTLYYGMAQSAEGMEQGAWKATNCSGKSVLDILNSATPCPTCPPKPWRRRMLHAPCSTTLRVVASRSHCNEETTAFIQALEKEFGEADLVSSGSSLKLCLVAEGRADVYPRIAPTMEWDTAAAQAVVEASGGRVVKYDPAVPAVAYLTQSAEREAQSEKRGEKDPCSAPCAMPSASSPMLSALCYNKENLLNPHFVVSR
jgi:3'(2'), 5'-bisphosphate nucleotidase